MAWHRYTLVVIGLTACLCIQKGNSEGNSTGQTPAPEGVCETPRCLSAANGMIQRMNLSTNPCEDFNEFACGRFIKKSKIRKGRSAVSTFIHLWERNMLTRLGILKEKVNDTDPQYLKYIRRFYNSCMDEDTIEAVGLAPYLNDREFVDDWPTLNPSWSGANFDLNEVIVRYSKVLEQPIFHMLIKTDMADSNKMALYLSPPNLTLRQKYYNLPRKDTTPQTYEQNLLEFDVELNVSRHLAELFAKDEIGLEMEFAKGSLPHIVESHNEPTKVTTLQAYENYLVEFAVALNASREVAEQDAKDLVDLEIELAKIMVLRGKGSNSTNAYNSVKLNQLSTMYPELDIVGFTTTIFGLANITLTGEEIVYNVRPAYIGNISKIVQKFSNRTIQNLFGFYYAMNRVGVLTHRMRQLRQEYLAVYNASRADIPRVTFCMDSTLRFFSRGVSKQFITRLFSESAKRDVNTIIDNLKEVFKTMIEEATWMSNATKTEALAKLAAMKQKVGYPDSGYADAEVEKFYEKHTMKAGDYYNNVELLHKIKYLQLLKAYGTPLNKRRHKLRPYEIATYFIKTLNEIAFPAGILQPPFYSKTFQDYMKYGAIGTLIINTILYGYDNEGKHYDAMGEERLWWTPEDSQNFANKSLCIIDQNFNTYVEEVNMTLNGTRTLRQSMGDRAAIKTAYRAYKNLVSKSGQQPRLPGLQLSQDQMFFLAFAQQYCSKYTLQGLIDQVTSSANSPSKYRILGALQNSEDFAKAYNCPVGSFMNPAEKCNVW